MSALAVKVESVPQLVPNQLTLRDPSCGPKFSNDRFAYFSFEANSCGTTRTVWSDVLVVLVLNAYHLRLLSLPQFYDGVVTYQNEITLGTGLPVYQPSKKGVPTSHPDPEYR